MSPDYEWPESLAVNAYTGSDGPLSGRISNRADRWVLGNGPPEVRPFLKAPEAVNERDWTDPRVGWGLVLPERPGLTTATLANGADAPQPIRDLLEERGMRMGQPAPVFRYRPNSNNRLRLLRNYRDQMDISITGSPRGIRSGALPQYLLIYGTPAEIPWDIQYVLNAGCFVGRLALDGEAIKNYIAALLSNWKNAKASGDRALIWAVDYGVSDITHLMRYSIALPLHEQFSKDNQMRSTFLDGSTGGATAARLRQDLAVQQPGIVITTSHGKTGPLDDMERMGADLGLLVDQNYETVAPDALLTEWSPDGAIWYAHACCSAGSDNSSIFVSLVEDGSMVHRVLTGISKLGPRVAPLPQKLLGAPKPLRAFVGHVEPTFDWTLRQPSTGQYLTDPIRQALYFELCQREPTPIGFAMRAMYARLSSLFVTYDTYFRAFNSGQNTRGPLLWALLAARDVQSMVILGDPTALCPT